MKEYIAVVSDKGEAARNSRIFAPSPRYANARAAMLVDGSKEHTAGPQFEARKNDCG
jgi:hypothetical protein